ncbi:zinc finger protein CONSTANS-LIKE 6 [Malania oleifera]|uniref:zinc finger protein CONSTANS-LIKE 6 n=1 Tax=Malania oleifera TaxID=397392 RepID=UPI0025ADE708|nr:zinc finger protein CONSTANS-LIKE 6 [Malania oleifera]
MCNKDTPGLQTGSMINKGTGSVTVKPARKTRTRTRKPKFLSLRLQLSPENSQESSEITRHGHRRRRNQLNLFPLHPENLVEAHDENVADLFCADGGATLAGLLGGGDGVSSEELSPSLSYGCGVQDSGEYCESALWRTALRSKERSDAGEERWVRFSEVVEEKREEEVTSCSVGAWCTADLAQGLSLKLDYDEIMNAWSDKGPLYVESDGPQTVPDVQDALTPRDAANVAAEGWRVPEKGDGMEEEGKKRKGGEGWKMKMKMMEQREASVLRYKEKRQNRLFSKRIRYEVRKLNAEKRPRMKGRFVKRN